MARIPARGTSIVVSPDWSEITIRTALIEICPDHAFDESTASDLFWQLGGIVGAWTDEQERLNTISVAKALTQIGRELTAFADDPNFRASLGKLRGFETGLRTAKDIEIASALTAVLARNQGIGSIIEANRQLTVFLESPTPADAVILAAACSDAADDLRAQVGRSGRPKLDWYDDFTKLLLEIADKANIKPTFWKDRTTDERRGWLFEAAQCLESFLHPHMRSSDSEACGKRLERSMQRLRAASN
ncbi:MAG: hypothetical protein ACTHNN_06790 [Xanthobacteraceae bacterium]